MTRKQKKPQRRVYPYSPLQVKTDFATWVRQTAKEKGQYLYRFVEDVFAEAYGKRPWLITGYHRTENPYR